MLYKFRQGLIYLRDTLARESIPVWLSLLLVVAGALGAYWIAPLINEKFEIQAARREFLVKNLEGFSADTKGLVDIIYKSINEKDPAKYKSAIGDAGPLISKLQFSATQLLYIVPDEFEAIVKFQKSLDSLQDVLIAHKAGNDSVEILSRAKLLMQQSLSIYEALLSRAGLGDRISARNDVP
jgi:hypothetical protein